MQVESKISESRPREIVGQRPGSAGGKVSLEVHMHIPKSGRWPPNFLEDKTTELQSLHSLPTWQDSHASRGLELQEGHRCGQVN